ncbi:uncharacterized protein [Rutidosis leptorrhynchoides]|uniref:uncharacterized protein n=1 Tax=Rutidosis leptorrhynchoides TaxID=125765 RepID=UPI003A9984E9
MQEMKCDNIDEKFVELMWGSTNFKFIQKAAVGRSGGSVLIWDNHMFQVDQVVEGNFFLAIKGKIKGQMNDIIVVNVYGPHEDCKKSLFLDSLDKLMQFDNEDLILCGDFNEKFSKLDRFLVSNSLMQHWNDLSVLVLDRKLSDHCPLLFRTKTIDYGPKPTKVFNSWYNAKGAEEIIIEAWNLENVKLALIKWSKEKFGKLYQEIEQARAEASDWEQKADDNVITDVEREKWLDARRMWLEKDKVKTSMLKQKARLKWVAEGGENTSNKISIEDANRLERTFDEHEVWMAIKGCAGSKALGPDGFNFKFFKKIWKTVKHDLLLAIEWIREVLPKIIGKEQSVFISGRSIVDGILVLKESVADLKRSKNNSFLLKADFAKAFDSVNWKFRISMMTRMRFGLKWVKWIETCLKSATISILVNGSPIDEFKLERGIRQGDPLSPFLFIIAGEGLNLLVNVAIEKGLVHGVAIGKDKIPLPHLQYADDTIIIGAWSKRNISNTLNLLSSFEDVSGLKINLGKSKLYGINVSPNDINDMADRIGCEGGKDLAETSYFGRTTGLEIKVFEIDFREFTGWRQTKRSKMNGDGLCRFHTKMLTEILEEKLHGQYSSTLETDRNKSLPRLLEIFVWRANRRRLPVRVELDNRGIDLYLVRCPMCDEDLESMDHALILCKSVFNIWEKIYRWWGLGNFSITSVNELFKEDVHNTFGSTSNSLWQAVKWVGDISSERIAIRKFFTTRTSRAILYSMTFK